jgi:hypothetical protein
MSTSPFLVGWSIGHQIIPWHEAAFQLDDLERLLGTTRDQLETEAYLAGGHLIFQGQHFLKHALDYQVTIATPIALAPDYGASRHATIRYYALHHPDTVALLAARPMPLSHMCPWGRRAGREMSGLVRLGEWLGSGSRLFR